MHYILLQYKSIAILISVWYNYFITKFEKRFIMTSTEKWNFVVKEYTELYSSLESKIQEKWDLYCTDLFGFRKLFNEMVAQKHLSVGANNTLIPDIILRINNEDVFDIELKQYSLPFDNSFQKQLISYLNQTHISVGMIVCNKIYLYCYDYATITINKIEIPFEENNPDGIKLMGLLDRDSFDSEKIKNFVLEKNKHENDKLEIKQTLTSDWIKEVVKEKLLNTYCESDINSVLNDICFNIVSSVKTLHTFTPMQNASMEVRNSYNNDIDVLSIIRSWCQEKAKLQEIIFPNDFSNKKHTRFQTPDLDKFIPYQPNCKNGWGIGRYYAYEIENDSNKFRFKLVFNNQNTPSSLKNVFSNFISLLPNKPQKTNWEFWMLFSTKSFYYNSQTTAQDIYGALESQYKEIRKFVLDLIKYI